MNVPEPLRFDLSLLDIRLFQIGNTPITLVTLIIFSLIVVASLLVSSVLQRALVTGFRIRGITDEGTIGVTRKLLHYFVMFIGLGIGLQTIGINLATLFAAGAVFAIGIGFAMQNIAQNFVSGIILLLERSIKPGDVLRVEDRVVRVRKLGIRATIARTLDDEEIIVPNSLLVQSVVTNYTLRDSLYRLRCPVGVTYGSDMALVRKTLEEVAGSMHWRVHGKDPVILMREFGSSSVNFEVSVWMDNPWGIQRAVSELNESIWWALKNAGITIAFPQLDVHLDPAVTGSLQAMGRSTREEGGGEARNPN